MVAREYSELAQSYTLLTVQMQGFIVSIQPGVTHETVLGMRYVCPQSVSPLGADEVFQSFPRVSWRKL